MKREIVFLLLFPFSLLGCELVYTRINLNHGIALYAALLALLMIMALYLNLEKNFRHLVLVFMLLPLTRIVGSAMEIRSLVFEARLSVVYTVIFLSSFLLFYQFPMKLYDIGYRTKGFKFLPAAVLLGAALGFIEYLILKPEIQIEPVNMRNALFSLFVFLLFTGYVEELIFRGLMQSLLEKILPYYFAIVYCNVLFLIMHIIWGSILELLFVFSVGIILGYIFYRTRNLFLISVIHGMINFHLFVIFPLLMLP